MNLRDSLATQDKLIGDWVGIESEWTGPTTINLLLRN